VSGKDIEFVAEGYGTDCYPRKRIETSLNLGTVRSATLLNPRNCYQNYNVAVNMHSDLPLYTYLGILHPGMANANFCSAGQLSPLLKDPYYRTIGIGTRIFLGGGIGYVFFQGTQHDPDAERGDNGVPVEGAGTLAVVGDLRGMSQDFLRGVSIRGYGVSLAVGIGVAVPILDEDLAASTGVGDKDLFAPVYDYSRDYQSLGRPLCRVSYAELRSGSITVGGRKVRTASLSSYAKAREIAGILKEEISSGRFLVTRPSAPLPGSRGECGL